MYYQTNQNPKNTYEILENRNPNYHNSLNYSTMNSSLNSGYNYDQFFNMNFQNSVVLTDYDEHKQKKQIEESLKNLLNQNERLNFENGNLKNQINQMNNDISEMKEQISKLINDNAFLEDKLGILSEQNQEMSHLINEQKNQLLIHQNENQNLNDQQIQLSNQLLKSKKSLKNIIQEDEDLRQQNEICRKELNENRSENDLLMKKHNQLNDEYRKNIQMLNQLKEENDLIKNQNEINLNNKDALIEDLKNQIDILQEQLLECKKDKNNLEILRENENKNNNKKISDLNDLINKLTFDNENLNKKSDDNKRLNKRLLREKETLIEKINDLQNDLNNQIIKGKRNKNFSPENNNNPNNMLSNYLKNENTEIKDLNEKYKEILIILFNFLNWLNGLFNHNEIYIDQCRNNINLLNDDIEKLKNDILNLLKNNENDEETNKKFKEIQNKLMESNFTLNQNKNNIDFNFDNKIPDEKELSIENDWKSGNCWACKLGRNVSLKGASPYFCQKHRFTTNIKK